MLLGGLHEIPKFIFKYFIMDQVINIVLFYFSIQYIYMVISILKLAKTDDNDYRRKSFKNLTKSREHISFFKGF